MHSCIYEGQVRHRRHAPTGHEFQYPLYLLYLDLEELKTIFRNRWLWSANGPNLAWFRREDHLGSPDVSLDSAVRTLVHDRMGRRLNGPIRLLTNLRYFGYAMNPVSFFFCFDEQDQNLETIVAEVTNTPWGEQYCYVLNASDGAKLPGTDSYRFECSKDFHVSPFMEMQMQYRWRLTTPAKRLAIQIENHDNDSKVFDADLTLARREVTGHALTRVLIRYPFISAKVAMSIYWQAARLWRKKVPFVPHPKHTEGTMRPPSNTDEPSSRPRSPSATFQPPPNATA